MKKKILGCTSLQDGRDAKEDNGYMHIESGKRICQAGYIVIYPRVCAGVVSGGPACTAVGVLTWRRWGTFAVGKGIWVDDDDGVESGLGLRPIGRERGRTHWVAVLDGASKPTKSLQRALFCAKGAGWMESVSQTL
ncbi:hypothetical protein BJ912DRAFT_933173 [Pholiota molesta]|nr:hypothetical protein BJ912DRAFT_933173 [Pholiota molesta]